MSKKLKKLPLFEFEKEKRNFWQKVFLAFLLAAAALLFSYWITGIFTSEMAGWETATLIVRKHHLGDSYQIKFVLQIIFVLVEQLERLFWFLDDLLPFFPSSLKILIWTERAVCALLQLPFLLLTALLLVRTKSKKIKYIALLYLSILLLPIPYLVSSGWNYLIVKGNLNYQTPFSKDTVWVWSVEENETVYTLFQYEWEQKAETEKAEIFISNLGHYRLIVNGEDVYDGPSFAVLPQIYFDKLPIDKYIKKGKNQIIIIANFISLPVHEYSNYPEPGLLIGGRIKNGIFYQNLADGRFWKAGAIENIENGQRISADAGFTKLADFREFKYELKLKPVKEISRKEYEPTPRPLPLLKYQKILPSKTGEYYDLGRFAVGYLEIKSNFLKDCTVKINWLVKINNQSKSEIYFNQSDELKLPPANFKWRQLSRRAGRYIQIEKDNCPGEIELEFYQVGMPFEKPLPPKELEKADREIYDICLNTLENNVQDHFEDCAEREKAMYIGDALEVSKCLMRDGENDWLIKEMIKQFAQSQKDNGIIPSMTPSGKEQYIPGYALQWAIWLDQYVSASGDLNFAKQMKPHWIKLMDWAQKNESPEGFIYNKENDDWWNFVDWTPIDNSYSFSTPLQIWYLGALESVNNLNQMIGEKEGKYLVKAERLRKNLIESAFGENEALFSDSFGKEKKSDSSLITNALAGKYNLFPSEEKETKAIGYFIDKGLFTQSPYSQSWVVEWLLEGEQKDLAKKLIREYWGSMVKKGASSVYEVYNPNTKPILNGSHSHAWGCGPIYLYKNI